MHAPRPLLNPSWINRGLASLLAGGVAAGLLVFQLAESSDANMSVACQYDGQVGCVWDAKHQGDGTGKSYVAAPDGRVMYIGHSFAHRLLEESGATAPPPATTTPPPPATTTPPPPATTTPPPPATTTPPPPAATTSGFPTIATTGVPRGWTPSKTVSSLRVSEAGAVIQDVRVTGTLTIAAPNVTLRRVEVVGASINNYASSECHNGLQLEQVTVRRGTAPTSGDWPAITAGGYSADSVLIDGMPEGFRVGGSPRCGPVAIRNSYANVVAPDQCGDWHGDALQGYGGGALTLRNSVMSLKERGGCGGTASFFYPSGQGNTKVDIDGLIVTGGGFPFRLGMPGTVKNLHIGEGSWGYGPIDVKCSALTSWQASISKIGSDGQPSMVRAQACSSNGGA